MSDPESPAPPESKVDSPTPEPTVTDAAVTEPITTAPTPTESDSPSEATAAAVSAPPGEPPAIEPPLTEAPVVAPDLGAKSPDAPADQTQPLAQSPEERARETHRRNAALFENRQVTVLQPMTSLKGWEIPAEPVSPEDEKSFLGTWTIAMERALREERPADTVKLAHVILRQLPRHLGTYQRLIRAAWQLQRWDEGDAWGRRLLRADPANAIAWRAVAMAAEQRGDRARAHARWQRAFECDPYDPEIRAGLVRTSVDITRLPTMNEAALASLWLRGFRWEQAAATFRKLIQQDSRRLDYQTGLLLSIWQMKYNDEAYEFARELTQSQPYLLVAWVIIDETGDADDKALARHPVRSMDPDGDYLRTALGLVYPGQSVRMAMTSADKALLTELSPGSAAD